MDNFAIEAGARSNSLDTVIRVDGPAGLGTTIDIEDLLGVEKDKENVGIGVEWRLGRRHLVGLGWVSHERSSTRTINQEIEVGDVTFPVNVALATEFDMETLSVSYRYYLVLTDRTAFGVGAGLRNYDFRVALSAAGSALAEEADVSGPMPFLLLDYRYGITPRWRLRASAGVFDIEIDDFEGSQLLAELALEFRALRHLGVGVAADIGNLDVDVTSTNWTGTLDSDVTGVRLFARAIW